MSKSTFLIYGFSLPITRQKGEDDYFSQTWIGGRAWSDLLPHIEGHDDVAGFILYGEEPVDKAYFGMILATTSGRYDVNETDITGFWRSKKNKERQLLDEAGRLFGKTRDDLRLMLVDIVS